MRCFLWLLVLLSFKGQAEPIDALKETVKRAGLGARIEQVVPSPIPGLYQVELQGGRLIYGSADGRYLIQGYMYEVEPKGMRNLTAQYGAQRRAEMVAALPEAAVVAYSAAQQKAQIVVFVDTECPFCHKLHEDIGALNDLGITVKYVAYPRHGLDSEGYQKLVNVWCSENRKDAMDEALDGGEIDTANCVNPVAEQYELGSAMGIQGTPTIIFQNGPMVTGYQPVEVLGQSAIEASTTSELVEPSVSNP